MHNKDMLVLVHDIINGLINKPSNNSSSSKQIDFIQNFKNKYPVISITKFHDIYYEDVVFNFKMKELDKNDYMTLYSLNLKFYIFINDLNF